jgi:hypothetical protein
MPTQLSRPPCHDRRFPQKGGGVHQLKKPLSAPIAQCDLLDFGMGHDVRVIGDGAAPRQDADDRTCQGRELVPRRKGAARA